MKFSISIFILLAVLGFTSSSSANTNVGATLSTDTKWDQSGSPYIIQAHVLVPPGVTLSIQPGVQVVFQGPATLEIGGELKVEGSAAAPAVFNMTDGGLQSALFIDGGEAFMANAKVLGGVFLAQDATIRLDGADVTKGSGLYLKGTTVAHLKNNKFYGNATGVVLDGPVEADMQFNTMVQNTYGLYVKDFAKLVFINNSVHDNESEVVNNSTKLKVGGNYWGSMSPATVKNKIKGSANISPMKDLKDILRAYLRSELPVITKKMSDQAESEDKRADEAARAALKAFRAKYSQNDVLAIEAKNLTLTPQSTPTPVATATPVPPVPTPTLAMSGELAAPPALNAPTAVPTATFTVAPGPPAVSLPSAPAPSTAAPVAASIPAPPALSSSAPEPPALGQVVAPAETAAVSTPVTLPSSAAPATATPTFVLGGGGMTTDDLASIVATAQAASTSTTPAAAAPAAPANTSSTSSMPAPPAVSIPAPPMSSVSTNPNIPQEVLASPPMPPDLTNTGAAEAPAAQAVTSMPTAAATATFTMAWTNTPVPPAATDTPAYTATYTPTTVWTSTYTDTPVPAPPTATATPIPTLPMTLAPAPAAPMVSAPAAPAAAAPGLPSAGAPTLAGSSAAQAAAPAAASSAAPAPAASSASAPPMVPPAPDFGDNSMTYGVQAPSVPINNNPPAAAPQGQSFPTSSGNKDLDVDGMQAPPMDSGLDFAAPKK